METSLVPAFFGLLGTIVGGLITFGTQWLQEKRKLDIERLSLAWSLAAEIEGFLNRSELGVDDVTNWKAHAERGLGMEGLKENWKFHLYSEPFPVYSANISKIGLLGFASGDVVTFYDWAQSLGSFRKQVLEGRYDDFKPEEMGLILGAHQSVLDLGRKQGRRLVERLRSGDIGKRVSRPT